MAPFKRMQLWPFEKEKDHFVKKLCGALRHIEELRRLSQRRSGSLRRMQLKASDVKNKIFAVRQNLTTGNNVLVERTVEVFLDLLNILENELRRFTTRLDNDKRTHHQAANEIQSHYMRLIRAMNKIECVSRQGMRNMAIPSMFWFDRLPSTNMNELSRLWRQGKFEQRVNALRDKIDSVIREMRQ